MKKWIKNIDWFITLGATGLVVLVFLFWMAPYSPVIDTLRTAVVASFLCALVMELREIRKLLIRYTATVDSVARLRQLNKD